MAIPTFVDQVTLHLAAGRGGNGVASVKREKFKPLGGPDGGNGGQGGSIILQVDTSVTTLVDYHHSPKRRADNGGQGAGDHKNGGNGKDLVLTVPDGTLVKDSQGNVLADLVGQGTTLVIAAGGRGGLGNAALAAVAAVGSTERLELLTVHRGHTVATSSGCEVQRDVVDERGDGHGDSCQMCSGV